MTEKDSGIWPSLELPSSWAWAEFETLFDNRTSSGKKLAQKQYAVSGAFPVIDQGQGDVGGWTDEVNLAYEGRLPVIVFGDHTRCVKLINRPFVQGADGVKVLVPHHQLDSSFVFHAMNAVVLPDKGYSRHYKFLRATRFPTPPLNEQPRIVAKIEALQARSRRAREALEAVPPLLEKFRQSVLAAAFRGDLTADWRAKNPDVEPASKLLERIRIERRRRWEEAELAKMEAKGKTPKDDKWKAKYKEPEPVDPTGLPELPEGWCWANIDELSDRVTDGEHQTPPRTEDGVRLLSARNVRNGFLSFEKIDFISNETYLKVSRRLSLCENDVLLTCSGTVGRSCLVPSDSRFALVRSVAVIKPVLNMGAFLTLSFRSPFLQAQMTATKTQTAQSNLFQGKIKRLVMPFAPAAEQHEVTALVGSLLAGVSELSDSVDSQQNLIDQLDESILAKAFRGELVPQDPDDEPASVLLDRIRAERAKQEKPKRRSRKKESGAS